MKRRTILCILCVIGILLSAAGCGQSGRPADSENPTVSNTVPTGSTAAQDTPAVDPANVDFSDMPAIDAPMVRLHPGQGTLLFEFIVPGMDSSNVTLVNYSLTQNKTLAKIDLGDGIFQYQTGDAGSFTVYDVLQKTVTGYAADGKAGDTVTIDALDGGLSFIAHGANGRMLIGDQRSGELYLISADGRSKTKVDFHPGLYEPVDCVDNTFVVTYNGQEVLAIEPDGSAHELFSKGYVQFANRDYAAGRMGDHLAFFPLQQGDWLFVNVADHDEELIAASNGAFLTSSVKDDGTVLRLYRMAKLKYAQAQIPGRVEAAAVTADGMIVAACSGGDGFSYQLIDPASWPENPFSSDNDLSAVLGAVTLPPIGNRDETDTFAKDTLERYNVRFLYESCDLIDAFEEIGLQAKLSFDRARIHHVETKLAQAFDFFPDAVWKHIGGELPLIVLLCDQIPGNVEGLSFEFGGYNCIFVEIGGNDSVYTHIFMHEAGHAIDNLVKSKHPELIDEWLQLTPQDVREAVEKGTVDGKNALTIEYSPDDRVGPVCYVSAYATTNPEEDRAETLAKFFQTIYVEKDDSLFSHEVLKKKARQWGKMIRVVFDLDESVPLPFDGI
jgi:hypothetical protein